MILVWSCLLLLPFGRLVEVPVAIMAMAGLFLLWRHWREWLGSPNVRLFSLVFLAAWVPIILSSVDAVHPQRAAMTAVNHLRFYFSGLFILYALRDEQAHGRFLALSAWLLAFWLLDAVVQMALGRDLFGFAVPMGRVNALFGEGTPVFSLTLAVVCPLLWEHGRRHWPRWLQIGLVLVTVLVVLVAGTRSAWISMAVLVLAYGVLLARRRRVSAGTIAAVMLAGCLGVWALYQTSQPFAERLDSTVSVFTGEADPIMNAVGHRFWIWRAAGNMFLANPVNGVGARGFRYAYADHASPQDPYLRLDPPIPAMHSHQLWLEVLAETGAVGALGLATLLGLLIGVAWRADSRRRQRLLPYGLCLLVAYFPFNTHMAIYSSFWSQIVWWLIALYLAAYGARGIAPAGSRGGTTEDAPRRHADRYNGAPERTQQVPSATS